MAELTGSAVKYGAPIYNQYGTETADTAVQSDTNCIIQVKFGSASTVDQGISGNGARGDINGTEVSMGVPTKSTNWYRIYYQTVADDTNGNVGGWGIEVWRWTPSSGYERALGQGEHASYDNNMSDWYRTTHGIFYVPVHQTYPTQEHRFKLMWRVHDSVSIRINSSIGNDNRAGNWQNNAFEVWEIDGDRINTGTLTRY
jgi:hypothetical protein